jgi:hypothetical protein
LKNYNNNFDSLKTINNKCIEEDETYKKSLYKKQRGLSSINKEKRNEKNKFSINLPQRNGTLSKNAIK